MILPGGKKKGMEGEASGDDSCLEESDEYNEGAEHDYISSDSSEYVHLFSFSYSLMPYTNIIILRYLG